MADKPLTVDEIQSRIVDVRKMRFGDVFANPRNPKRHPANQRAALRGSVRELGFGTVPIAYTSRRLGGKIAWGDGHLRGDEFADYVGDVAVTDYTDEEIDKFILYADPIAAMAEHDATLLDALLKEVQTGDAALQEMLAGLAAEAGLYPDKKEIEDPGPQIDKADELRQKWGVTSGSLWLLDSGNGHPHRLICGDCTDKATVDRLMGGEKAEMVWTDPPYGVAVGDKNKYLNSIAKNNRVEKNLANDTLDEPQLIQMLCASFDNALSVCAAGGAWYVAAPAGPPQVLFGQILKDRGIWHQTIQWVKNNATFSPMGVDYHWQAEPIFYGWKPGAGHRYYGGRQQTTVWEIDRPLKSPEHPTMKPVELVARAVENSSQAGEIVYDPFAGSGTTCIACESLNRQARLIEIDPGYCGVILERWSSATSQQPQRID